MGLGLFRGASELTGGLALLFRVLGLGLRV